MIDVRPVVDLADVVTVVTGAAGGIGAGVAERFALAGATVLVADLDESAAKDTAEQVSKRALDTGVRGSAIGHRLDVTDSSSVEAAADRVLAEFGRVDVLVNAAGIVEDSATFDLDESIWSRSLEVNLTGTFRTTRSFARRMTGGGSIVSISSMAGIIAGQPEKHLAYDVSKAGVAHMTRVLGAEWAGHGIRVNAVAPGRVDTPLLRSLTADTPGIVEDWISQAPMKRLIAPTEIADGIAFLASPAASAITSQVLVIDGGLTVV